MSFLACHCKREKICRFKLPNGPSRRLYLFISRRIFGIHWLPEDNRKLVLVDLFERITYITSCLKSHRHNQQTYRSTKLNRCMTTCDPFLRELPLCNTLNIQGFGETAFQTKQTPSIRELHLSYHIARS